jgi:anti-anti-sigma regulatory factor
MGDKSFSVTTNNDGVSTFTLNGPINEGMDEDLQLALIGRFDNGSYRIILDFTNCEKINSKILKVISWASEIIVNNEGRLVLAGLTPVNFEIFDFVGMEELAEMVPDMEFAMALFQE